MTHVSLLFWKKATGPLLLRGDPARFDKHTFGDGQRRAPLIPQDVETDAAVRVDVRVVDAGGEVDLWRLERVVGREVDG
jgi:hypothetical protein